MGEVIEFGGLAKLREEVKQRDILIRKLVEENKLLAGQVQSVMNREELLKLQLVEISADFKSLTQSLTKVALSLNDMANTLNGK